VPEEDGTGNGVGGLEGALASSAAGFGAPAHNLFEWGSDFDVSLSAAHTATHTGFGAPAHVLNLLEWGSDVDASLSAAHTATHTATHTLPHTAMYLLAWGSDFDQLSLLRTYE